MNSFAVLAFAKLIDWPTLLLGLGCGLLARAWWHVIPLAIIASVVAEVVLMLVRGWSISLPLFALGVIAALPWVAIGYALRSFVVPAR